MNTNLRKKGRYSILKYRFAGLSKNLDVIITKNESETGAALALFKLQNPNAIIGFVPTMGALHEGHLSLIREAKLHCDFVVCSIFVNPTQFNNRADLERYPRTVEADKILLESVQCDLLLVPTIEAVYPLGVQDYEIDLEGLDRGMEGQFRPGHFKGVCMVVERLFAMVLPQKAFFGAKDFQQLAIIRKMTAIRKLPIEIIGVTIKRAENGLALSSRNTLLTDQERENAQLIYRALKVGVEFGQTNRDANAISARIQSCFDETEFDVEYIAIVDNDTLLSVPIVNENTTICIVVYYCNVRLIDNMSFYFAAATAS